jgi:hypothetical protein
MFKKPVYKQTEHGFVIIENAFTLRERFLMKRQLCPLVKDLGDKFPGLQSDPDMDKIILSRNYFNFYTKLFSYFILDGRPRNIKIIKSWINYQDKYTESMWHTHPYCTNTCVYYLTNPEGKGTLVDIDGKETHYEAKENSLLLLPSHIRHSAPRVNKKRYSVVVDFNLLEEWSSG